MCEALNSPNQKKEMEILLYLTSRLKEVGFFPRGSKAKPSRLMMEKDNLGEEGKTPGVLGEANPPNRISLVKYFYPT